MHEGSRDYQCKSCNKTFADKGCLKKHIKKVHEIRRDLKCESCKAENAYQICLTNLVSGGFNSASESFF